MAIVTYEEAQQIVGMEQRKLNDRRLPPTLLLISQTMKEHAIFACNVGPWPHNVSRPSLSLSIPAYDPKTDTQKLGYVKSDPFPGIHRFSKIASEDEMGWCEDPGRAVLLDLIGIGFGMPAQQSLTRFGVFVPESKEPTRAEIAAATDNLNNYMDELIREARELYDAGGESRKAIYHPNSRYLQAARLRGVNESWVTSSANQQSVQCEMCGKFNPEGVAKCACGTILDFELFQRIQKRQDEMMEQATRPGKK